VSSCDQLVAASDRTQADLEIALKVAREVDEGESPVNAIVSVLMLREGSINRILLPGVYLRHTRKYQIWLHIDLRPRTESQRIWNTRDQNYGSEYVGRQASTKGSPTSAK
jgi:hypothetical protein